MSIVNVQMNTNKISNQKTNKLNSDFGSFFQSLFFAYQDYCIFTSDIVK